jgi:putative hydrolase of the HAD superfamily
MIHCRAMPIQAFLFDIGNVLLKFDFSKALRAIAHQSETRDEAETLDRIDAVKQVYEDGRMSRAEFLEAVFRLLRYRGTEAEFIAAWEDIFDPVEATMALAARLAPRFPLFLLSNTNDIHLAYVRRRYRVFEHFRGGTYSCEVQASKPGREIYEIACRAHGLTPERTFFIDDLAANIATARDLGFVAHRYDHRDHSALEKSLCAAGVEG